MHVKYILKAMYLYIRKRKTRDVFKVFFSSYTLEINCLQLNSCLLLYLCRTLICAWMFDSVPLLQLCFDGFCHEKYVFMKLLLLSSSLLVLSIPASDLFKRLFQCYGLQLTLSQSPLFLLSSCTVYRPFRYISKY